MTWTKLGDDFTDRVELLELPRSVRLLLVEMYVWANRLERDGRVPFAALRRLSDIDEPEAAVKLLAEAGLLEIEENAAVLDWSDQDLAEDVKARKKYRADVQKRYRKRDAAHKRDDHTLCDPRYCKAAVTGNASSNENGHETHSRPDPSRPFSGGRDSGAGPGAAAPGPRPKFRPHTFVDDGCALSCERCELPPHHPVHAPTEEKK